MTALRAGSVALTLLAAAPAMAADMSVQAPPVAAAPAAAMNWSGFYFGGSVGGAWDHPDRWVFPFFGSSMKPPGGSGVVGGIHTGANWQFGQLVLGTESSFRFADLQSSDTCPNPSTTCQQRERDIATFGGRLGWTLNNWLLFGTGGYARTLVETSVLSKVTGGFNDGTTQWHSGWYGGAGVDYAWTPNIIVGLQYTHVNINSRVDGSVPFQGIDDRRVGGKIDMVEARVSFKLWSGMWGPFSK